MLKIKANVHSHAWTAAVISIVVFAVQPGDATGQGPSRELPAGRIAVSQEEHERPLAQWLDRVKQEDDRWVEPGSLLQPMPGDASDFHRRLWAARRLQAARSATDGRSHHNWPVTFMRNGTSTMDFDATGALLYRHEDSGRFAVFCSGTLIGHHHFLAAAHCFDHMNKEDESAVEALRVYLQHEGLLGVAEVTDYCEFAPEQCDEFDDLAVVVLEQRPMVVSPVDLKSPGSELQGLRKMVGFGMDHEGYVGTKQSVEVPAMHCEDDPRSICYSIDGPSGPAACFGDSGGPMYDVPPETLDPLLAAVARWTMEACMGGTGTHTNLAHPAYQDWLEDEGLTENAGPMRQILSNESTPGFLTPTIASLVSHSFEVPPDADLLRVTINHDETAPGHEPATNRFGMSLHFDADPVVAAACACDPQPPAQFAHCHCSQPPAGTWRIEVERMQGEGLYQLTALALKDPPPE